MPPILPGTIPVGVFANGDLLSFFAGCLCGAAFALAASTRYF